MVETFFYFTVFFLFIFISSLLIKYTKNIYIRIFAILFTSLFIGLRLEVGIDYFSYLDEFIISKYFVSEKFELLSSLSQYWLSSNGYNFSFWLCLMAFVQIFCLFNFFKGKMNSILPITLLMFFLMYFSSLTNIIRQMCAVLIFLNSIKFIQSKSFFKYFITIFIGFLFHKSILIMLPFFFINYLDFSKISIKIQFLILLISSLFSYFISSFINDNIFIFNYFGYSSVAENFNINDTLSVELGSGLGRLFNWFSIFLVIIYNKKLRLKFSNSQFNFVTFYNLFFIYSCTYQLTYNIIYFQRILLYFQSVNFLIYSFLIYYLIKSTDKYKIFNRAIGYSILFINVIFFIKTIIDLDPNVSPYKFIF